MFGEKTTISYVQIWNHPIETTILKWMFQVPGIYHITLSVFFAPIGWKPTNGQGPGSQSTRSYGTSPLQRLGWIRLVFFFSEAASVPLHTPLHPPKKNQTKNLHKVVVSNILYFHPYLGKIPILTNIFQMGWNHQPEITPSPPKQAKKEKQEDVGLLNVVLDIFLSL